MSAQYTMSNPKPDRLLIGQWDYSKEDAARWTYVIHPVDITDTVAAMY